jgi:hypothetical protein
MFCELNVKFTGRQVNWKRLRTNHQKQTDRETREKYFTVSFPTNTGSLDLQQTEALPEWGARSASVCFPHLRPPPMPLLMGSVRVVVSVIWLFSGYFSPLALLLPVTLQCNRLRHFAGNLSVAGSIADDATEMFHTAKSFQPHCGAGVDSAPNRNAYCESSYGVKRCRCANLTASVPPMNLSAYRWRQGCQPYTLAVAVLHRNIFPYLALISVRGWVNPRVCIS